MLRQRWFAFIELSSIFLPKTLEIQLTCLCQVFQNQYFFAQHISETPISDTHFCISDTNNSLSNQSKKFGKTLYTGQVLKHFHMYALNNAKLYLINCHDDVFKARTQNLTALFHTCISSKVPSLFLSLSQGNVLLIQSRSYKQMNPKQVVN